MNWNDLEKAGVTYNEADAVLARDCEERAVTLAAQYLAGAESDSDETLFAVARAVSQACARFDGDPPPEWKRVVGYALALVRAREKAKPTT